MPYHPYNNVITGCLSTDQTGENLMIQGNNWRVHETTVHPHTAMQWPQWSAVCVAWPCHEGATLLKLFSGTNSSKASIQTTYCFNIAARVYCCPTKHKVHKTNLPHPKKTSHNFSCSQHTLKFLLPWGCNAVPFHWLFLEFIFKILHQDFILWQSATRNPHLMHHTSGNGFPSLFFCICHTCGSQLAQTLAQSSFSITATKMPLLADRFKHNLLHDSHHISVHQHSRCHTLLQCKDNHPTDHHTVLLFLFQFL